MISGQAKLAGVLGWPVGHSRSPRLHGYWIDQLKIDGAYVPLAVRPEHLAEVLRVLPRMGFKGVNLTVPHKEAAVGLVDHLDPVAARIGAVNTIVVGGDGSLTGRNTDGFGFLTNLGEQAPGWRPTDGAAVILGAGGAARAVAIALSDAGVPDIRIVNRSGPRAESLAADLACASIRTWDQRDRALSDAALVVNTTTLGMVGQPPLELALEYLDPKAVVNDIVYVPLETPLLAQARARGNRVVDGLGMLLWQAVPGFEAWFGQKPEVTAQLRDFVLGCS